ncbi:hypothetical protein AB6N23_02110 [Cellulomonas sp. 179-A 9B4 NHS]|uniref:hypothetical protein n=1 Tax=Cellulomonas sp. 179-A 9B4 NHS TaxID=3142379 RepID=UPI0039A26656
MTAYEVRPEVAGGLGDGTFIAFDQPGAPVTVLHYEFHGWNGDDIVTTSPEHIVTAQLAQALNETGLTGFRFDDVVVTKSEQFEMFHPEVVLPSWRWLRITGDPGTDDAWRGERGRLTVSDRFYEVLSRFTIANGRNRALD